MLHKQGGFLYPIESRHVGFAPPHTLVLVFFACNFRLPYSVQAAASVRRQCFQQMRESCRRVVFTTLPPQGGQGPLISPAEKRDSGGWMAKHLRMRRSSRAMNTAASTSRCQ
jgi:hypothetical protein